MRLEFGIVVIPLYCVAVFMLISCDHTIMNGLMIVFIAYLVFLIK